MTEFSCPLLNRPGAEYLPPGRIVLKGERPSEGGVPLSRGLKRDGVISLDAQTHLTVVARDAINESCRVCEGNGKSEAPDAITLLDTENFRTWPCVLCSFLKRKVESGAINPDDK